MSMRIEFSKFQKFLIGSILLVSGNVVENPNSIPFRLIDNTTGSTIPIALLGLSLLTTGLAFTLPFWWSQVKRMRGTQPFSFKEHHHTDSFE